jgi:uncharacterized lipoprotein YddW (UPF0748 family)
MIRSSRNTPISSSPYLSICLFVLSILVLTQPLQAKDYRPTREQPPTITREFRAAWVASVYNIDWPSRKGLSATAQKAELRALLDQAARLKLNAILFQIRPNGDALYASKIEPWSHWLTGTMGRSPGYDPLAYCISQAHARGIEVHAWFNPFRALTNVNVHAAKNHITRTHPSVVKRFKTYQWMDPSSSFARKRALAVISDVTRRYDIDGVHIDDYFYPYPDLDNSNRVKRQFPDGKKPSQRRSYVDGFVHDMYQTVKKTKPWVRVGISPFGIWRPGVPAGTTASIDSYEHLAADSRKWLKKGWCDYMSPQLYWRIAGPQGYTKLLSWWRAQGDRPVWPGIATARIKSSEDPGRPASEIVNQVNLSRTIGHNYAGQVHWSMKSLLQNRGGITSALIKGDYQLPALVPPMPWISKKQPKTPNLQAKRSGKGITASWSPVKGASKYALQARYGKRWFTIKILPASTTSTTLNGTPEAIAISSVDRYGTTSQPCVLAR